MIKSHVFVVYHSFRQKRFCRYFKNSPHWWEHIPPPPHKQILKSCALLPIKHSSLLNQRHRQRMASVLYWYTQALHEYTFILFYPLRIKRWTCHFTISSKIYNHILFCNRWFLLLQYHKWTTLPVLLSATTRASNQQPLFFIWNLLLRAAIL